MLRNCTTTQLRSIFITSRSRACKAGICRMLRLICRTACSQGHSAFVSIIGLAMLSILTSSCSFGKYIARPAYSQFPFGINSKDDLIQRYGEPTGKKISTEHDEIVQAYCYNYTSLAFSESKRGVDFACFYFSLWGMAGYMYLSNIGSDETRIDVTKIEKIQVGVTTKSDVLSLLGEPHGKMLYPLPDVHEAKNEIVLYNDIDDVADTISIYCTIEFDVDNIVRNLIVHPRKP